MFVIRYQVRFPLEREVILASRKDINQHVIFELWKNIQIYTRTCKNETIGITTTIYNHRSSSTVSIYHTLQ